MKKPLLKKNNPKLLNFNGDGQLTPSEILQAEHYYPFGISQQGHSTPPLSENAYTYNGKELNPDFGIALHDYGARQYDAANGRWTGIDPLAEQFSVHSPYCYAVNNPVLMIDPDGRSALAGNASGYRSAEDMVSEALEKRATMILEGLRNQPKNTLRQIAKMGKKAMRSWSSEQWSAVSEVFEENGVSNVNKRTFKRHYRRAVRTLRYRPLIATEGAYGMHNETQGISIDERIHTIISSVNKSIRLKKPSDFTAISIVATEFDDYIKEEQKRSTDFVLGVLFHEVAHYVASRSNVTDSHTGDIDDPTERGFLFEQKVLGYGIGGIHRNSPEAGFTVWNAYNHYLVGIIGGNLNSARSEGVRNSNFQRIYAGKFQLYQR